MKRRFEQPLQATKLLDHIRELQKRILVSVAVLVVAGIIVYFFYEPILNLLRSPLGTTLYYNNPAGSFAFVMKVCLMGALAVAMPVIVYNLIMFIRPAYHENITNKRVYLTAFMSSILAIAGAAFGFLVILPGTLNFFGGFQVDGLHALISADSYLNFVTSLITTFVIVFQLPLLIAFIDMIKPIPPKKLLKYEKWVVLGSLIIALVVPFSYDLVTSLMVAVPIVVLFNLSILMIAMRHAKAKRAEVKISRDISRIPSSSLMLADITYEDLVGHPQSTLATLAALPTASTAPSSVNNQAKRGIGMDVMRTKRPQAPVEPAEWYRKRHQQIPLGNHVQLISDFGKSPKVNRVLTSQ